MKQSTIYDAVFTGEEISPIVGQLEGILMNVKRGPAIVALLSMSIILQNPEISEDELHNAVRDTSRYICLLLEGEPVSETEKRVMN